jgi:hypothetical protein
MTNTFLSRLLSLMCVLSTVCVAQADEPAVRSLEQFDGMHKFLKRQADESRWMEVDWYPSVWEARQKAAAEGKPLFIWAGSGGAPAAGC